jgi:membrane-bound serine protease (ClpP class)
VAVYIAPSGATAGSAGVYITYAAHFAAMAHSTNIGAAHPVGGQGEDIDSVLNEKVTNDAVANIQSYAERRGRNAEWAEDAVRESVSITDKEALELNVIDISAADIDDLIAQIDGRTTEVPSGEVTMDLSNYQLEEIEISLVDQFLNIIIHPNIAYLLLTLGGLGLLVEIQNPGAIFPGVFGAIALILGLYAMSVLPISFAGIALLLLAVGFFIAEIKVTSGGLLGAGGVISLILGGFFLIDSVDPVLRVSWSVLITVAVLSALVLFVVARLVAKAHQHRPYTGNEGMIGKVAVVKQPGFVYVDGALWKADFDESFQPGDKVEITGVDKLTLQVRKLQK